MISLRLFYSLDDYLNRLRQCHMYTNTDKQLLTLVVLSSSLPLAWSQYTLRTRTLEAEVYDRLVYSVDL